MQDIWLEKYRPKTLTDVVGNPEIVDSFRQIVHCKSVPNMILVGPPGCGKTTSVLCIAREILGQEFSTAVLELNASDERGIDVVRSRIKEFAERAVKLPEGAHKIVILDESDSLTAAAQQALRMIISDYSNTTRFVFACNDSSKIIEPIQSRCVILRFTRLSEEQVTARLTQIAKNENVSYDEDGLKRLVFSADGDMRTAINNLQAVAVGASRVTAEKVYEICDIPNTEILYAIVKFCLDDQEEKAYAKMKQLWDDSFTAFDLVNHIGKVIESSVEDKDTLYAFLSEVAALKVRVLQGVGSLVQVLAFISRLCEAARQAKATGDKKKR